LAGTAIYTPQASDYGDLQRAIFLQQIRSRRFLVRLPLVIAAVAAAVTLIFIALGESVANAAGLALASALGGLVVVTMILISNYWQIPGRGRRLFEQQRTLHHEVEARWSPEGLVLRTPHGETSYPWSELHGWMEGPTLVLMQASDLLSHFIPKRALDAAALDDRRATLAASGLPRR
jgi:hypothetical protein